MHLVLFSFHIVEEFENLTLFSIKKKVKSLEEELGRPQKRKKHRPKKKDPSRRTKRNTKEKGK